MIRTATLVLVTSCLMHAQRSSAQAGDLDLNFHEDGFAFLNLTPDMDFGKAVAVLPDGKILIAGEAGVGGVQFGYIARYWPDGTPDVTFGTAGLATTQGLTYIRAGFAGMVVDAEQRIVVAGYGDDHVVVMRYLPTGTLDPAFDQDGQVQVSLGTASNAADVGLDGAGRIVVAVDVSDLDVEAIGAVRLLANGDMDPAFSFDGIATNVLGDGTYPGVLAVYPDGRVMIGGRIEYYDPVPMQQSQQSLLIRYQENGLLDDGFGDGGIDTISMAPGNYFEWVTDVLIKPDGAILVAGRCEPAFSMQSGYLLQLLPDGSFDPAFGSDGQLLVPSLWYGSKLVLQADGKFLASGGEMEVHRYMADGNLDPTFGDDGSVVHSSGYLITGIEDACLQPDGKLLVCGSVSNSAGVSDYSVMAARIVTGFTVGVVEFPASPDLRPYPQPADDWVLLPMDSPANSISLFDNTGRHLTADYTRYEEGLRIWTAQLPAGVYTALVRSANAVVARTRMVVAH